jgi:hypothetical protein
MPKAKPKVAEEATSAPKKPRPKTAPKAALVPIDYPGLTKVQNAFVYWAARLNNNAEAIRRSGSKSKSPDHYGYELMQLPHVADAVRKERARYIEALGIDDKWVLVNLVNTASKADEAGNHSAALRANELVGRHLKMFTDQVDHTVGLRLTHEEALAELE